LYLLIWVHEIEVHGDPTLVYPSDYICLSEKIRSTKIQKVDHGKLKMKKIKNMFVLMVTS